MDLGRGYQVDHLTRGMKEEMNMNMHAHKKPCLMMTCDALICVWGGLTTKICLICKLGSGYSNWLNDATLRHITAQPRDHCHAT